VHVEETAEPHAEVAEQNGPLEPMPPAPPERIAAWLRTMRLGALLSLTATLLAVPVTAAWAWFSLRPWWERWGHAAQWLSGAACMFLGIASVWLVTAAQPGRHRWRRTRRWAIRIGRTTAVLVSWGLSLRELLTGGSSSPGDPRLYAIEMAAGLASMLFALLLLRHLRALAVMLRDAWLRKRFAVLFWIGVGLAAVFVLGIGCVLSTSGGGQLPSEPPETAEQSPTGTAVFGMMLVCFALWIAWITWRLARRFERAAQEVAQTPP
jgi:hypothetical protein